MHHCKASRLSSRYGSGIFRSDKGTVEFDRKTKLSERIWRSCLRSHHRVARSLCRLRRVRASPDARLTDAGRLRPISRKLSWSGDGPAAYSSPCANCVHYFMWPRKNRVKRVLGSRHERHRQNGRVTPSRNQRRHFCRPHGAARSQNNSSRLSWLWLTPFGTLLWSASSRLRLFCEWCQPA